MNKQALAFLTMFSLVLMLSVYYVTLPSDSKSVMAEDKTAQKKDTSSKKNAKTEANEKVQNDKKNTSESKSAVKLQEAINQKKETAINKYNEVIANADSKEADKQSALSAIESLKNEQKEQQTLAEAIAKDGYQSSVEIDNTTCIVSVFDQKDDQAIAKKVMNKVSELTNNKYLVEVTFK